MTSVIYTEKGTALSILPYLIQKVIVKFESQVTDQMLIQKTARHINVRNITNMYGYDVVAPSVFSKKMLPVWVPTGGAEMFT